MSNTTRFIPVSVLRSLALDVEIVHGFSPCGECDACQIDMQGCTQPYAPITGAVLRQDGMELGTFYADTDDTGRAVVLFTETRERGLYQALRNQYRQVLWLSRHPITPEQILSLREEILSKYLHPKSPAKPAIIDIVGLNNVTFPAKGDAGLEKLQELAIRYNADTVSGVIPAQIAVAASRARCNGTSSLVGYIPVAVPAAAKEGETRAYAHSHFEWF